MLDKLHSLVWKDEKLEHQTQRRSTHFTTHFVLIILPAKRFYSKFVESSLQRRDPKTPRVKIFHFTVKIYHVTVTGSFITLHTFLHGQHFFTRHLVTANSAGFVYYKGGLYFCSVSGDNMLATLNNSVQQHGLLLLKSQAFNHF